MNQAKTRQAGSFHYHMTWSCSRSR